ncbi:hypothetical protein GK047_07925 [Paenibacillus sp. SYP-B3998]|uniref:Uncharacterized protein n=1 Tax=Paenibacillus sp. SYP-B3998 TaxID=2678564 RepID=A0A6G3ZUN8_9BACL|nr:hypothetical protein [Paenibacillus sp. SYP-B3998]NEW05936.1 hypothetical protein [Paenibacillus sp. SYP-B3998]
MWIVSDVAIGRAVTRSDRYKVAVKLAKERIGKNFNDYVAQVEKLLGEFIS